METFLVLNGYELDADVEDAETVMLELASGFLTREEIADWVRTHVKRLV